MRRMILTASLLASVVGVALAATPVVLTLNNGERVNGSLTYQSGTNNLQVDNRTVSMNDVAIISFMPGDPSVSELNSLPGGNAPELDRHMIVLRDGRVVRGKLYSFSADGSSVIYDNQTGQRQTVSSDQVARVYLDANGARNVYASLLNSNTSNPPAMAVGTSGVAGNTVSVAGNQPWTDTGIMVKKGDRLSFHASGEVQIAQGGSSAASPDGAGSFGSQQRSQYPVPAMPVGGLIARVGNGQPFPIGSNTQPITMPQDGRLLLGINDNNLGDNSGAFSVTISR